MKISKKDKDRAEMELKKNREYYKIFTAWRSFDFLQSFFSAIGLILAIILYESDIEDIKKVDEEVKKIGD